MKPRHPDVTKLQGMDRLCNLSGDGKTPGIRDLRVMQRGSVCYSFWVPTWWDILQLMCGRSIVVGVMHPPQRMPPIAVSVGSEVTL